MAGGKSMVGFAVGWLWVGGWVRFDIVVSGGDGGGALRGCGLKRGRRERDTVEEWEKKKGACGYILFYCGRYIILL